MSKTLCWECKNACGNCHWSQEFKEVDGWDATPVIIHNETERPIQSFIVNSCPLYQKDDYTKSIDIITKQQVEREIARLKSLSIRTVKRRIAAGKIKQQYVDFVRQRLLDEKYANG